MHIFQNRPLMLACCIAAVCAFAVSELSKMIALLLLTLSAFGVAIFSLLFLWKRHRNLFLSTLCCLLATLSSVTTFWFFHVKLPALESLVDREFVIEGTVLERLSDVTYLTKLSAEIESINGEHCEADMYIECSYASSLQPGDKFKMTVTGIAERDEKTNQILHCSGLSDGVMLTVLCKSSDDCQKLDQNQDSWRIRLFDWNSQLSFQLTQALGKDAGSLASALLLGNRDELSGKATLEFRRAGISHLLALSGLHVSILIGFAEWFLLRLRVPKGVRFAITATLAIFYLFLTGASPSTCRAVIMFFGLALGYYLRAEYDSLTTLSMALAILILITPYAILDLGMWMSFLAAASIIIFMPILQNGFDRFYQRFEPPIWIYKLLTGIISAIYIGIVANLAMLVILVIVYKEFSLMSIPATLILSLPISAGLLLTIITLVCPIAAPLCRFCMELMQHIAEKVSQMDRILLPANDLPTQILSVILFASVVFLAVAKLKRLQWGILPLGLSCACLVSSLCVSYLPNQGVRMDYVTESGGDLLLFSEKTHAVAVDFSDGTVSGAIALADVLANARCTELDDLILSHYHNKDTYFLSVLASTIRIIRLRLPQPSNEWEAGVAMRICEEAERLGIAVRFDMEELAIQKLDIRACDRALFASGRHAALLFSVQIGERDLTYVNASVPSSSIRKSAFDRIEESEILMFGSTGFSTKVLDQFPYLLHTPDDILILDERLVPLLPNIPQKSRSLIAPTEPYYCYFP